MLTPKQRALLRSHANTLDATLTIGKEGLTDTVRKSCYDILEAHEIVKVSIMRYAPFESAKDACDALRDAVHAEPVQVIGNKFVLYRAAREKAKLLQSLEEGH